MSEYPKLTIAEVCHTYVTCFPHCPCQLSLITHMSRGTSNRPTHHYCLPLHCLRTRWHAARGTYPKYIRTHATNDKRARIAQQTNSQLHIFEYIRRRWRQSFRRRQIVGFPMTRWRRQFSPRNLSAFVTPSKSKINPCGCAVADTAAEKQANWTSVSALRQKARQ